MKSYDLTDLSEEEKEKIFKEEGSRRPVYVTGDGQRLQLADSNGNHGPLKQMVPHPDSRVGIVQVRSDSEETRRAVANEHGGEPESEEVYRQVLTAISREKGWTVIWADDEPATAPDKTEKPRKPCEWCGREFINLGSHQKGCKKKPK